MSSFKNKLPQAGKNPAVDSDRVRAPVVGAGPKDSGEGQKYSTSKVEAEKRGKKEEEKRKKEGGSRSKEKLPTVWLRRITPSGTDAQQQDTLPEEKRKMNAQKGTIEKTEGSTNRPKTPPKTSPFLHTNGEEKEKENGSPEKSLRINEHAGKRKRKDESPRSVGVGKAVAGGRALEKAEKRAAELARILRSIYNPKKEIVNAVFDLRSLLRGVRRGWEADLARRAGVTPTLQTENQELKRRIAQLEEEAQRSLEEKISVEHQTEIEEQKRLRAQQERIRQLVQSDKMEEALGERWDETGMFPVTEVVQGDPLGQGFGADICILVGTTDSPLKERVLGLFPELRELEDGEGTQGLPFLRQACSLEKDGRVIEKLRLMFFKQMGSTSLREVFGATQAMFERMVRERRTRVILPLVPGANPWHFRKVVEMAALHQRYEGIKVLLYMPVGARTGGMTVTPAPAQQGGGKRDEGVVFVTRARGDTYSETLKKVRQLVAQSQTKVEIGSIRETRRGEVLLTLPKGGENSGEEIRSILSKGLGIERVRAGVGSRPVIFQVTGLDAVATGEEVVGAVAAAASLEPNRIKLLGIRASFGRCQTATIRIVDGEGMAANRVRLVSEVKIGINKCRIREKKDPGRCFRCWGVGHKARECKGVDRSRLCTRCAKEGHKARECNSSRFCPLCNTEGHSVGAPECTGKIKKTAKGADPEKEGPSTPDAQSEITNLPPPPGKGRGRRSESVESARSAASTGSASSTAEARSLIDEEKTAAEVLTQKRGGIPEVRKTSRGAKAKRGKPASGTRSN
ncbi:uncharacterized protein [Euwallacea fornicatus]|uniref:uncharacterized protein n=1 Tax=Euwallacea fornicatus TaxID=995702 RepID=UPI00338F22A4